MPLPPADTDASSDWSALLGQVLADPQAKAAFERAAAEVLPAAAGAGPGNAAQTLGQVVARAAERFDAPLQARLSALLCPPVAAPRPDGFRTVSGQLPRLDPQGQPGVSLVSCCKNRNANLVQAIRSWLPHDTITEIVLVDWSSAERVAETLDAAGIADPRIRILRVEGERHWILSHAFNAGFRAASCRHILKADADIVLAPGFFHANPLPEDGFVAGNWRTAGDGQAYVNGFFLAPRATLAAVGGFNEHIRSYGWDDEDLYDRLVLARFRRIDVAPGTVAHLDHDDAQRMGDVAPGEGMSVAEAAMASPQFLIRQNRFIAHVMPAWSGASEPIPFDILDVTGATLTLKRTARDPSAVPGHVMADAQRYALAEVLSWKLGKDLFLLAPEVARDLMALPAGKLTRFDILLALRGRMDIVRKPGRYLLLRCDDAVLTSPDGTTLAVLKDLVQRAEAAGMRPVFMTRLGGLPAAVREACGEVPHVDSVAGAGAVTNVMRRLLYENQLPEGGGLLGIAVTADVIDRMQGLAQRHPLPPRRENTAEPDLADAEVPVAAPLVAPARRGRLFIDAQHGLGNRLRAIASAGAIAAATGQELVVVWQSDDHCDCRMADLFDYPGAVIEERFMDRAAQDGQRLFNYMPHEPGAQKDAMIDVPPGADAYVRSAFVLRHPASTPESENAFLRALVPVGTVRDLVRSVRPRNDVAVHVRMEGGRAAHHLPYERPDNWTPEDHALIEFWRGKSHYSAFAKRLDALIASGEVRTIFLAADAPEAYAAFAQRYRRKVAFLERAVYDRSADQLRYALADAILLSQAPRLLASNWSSFSELAMRLAPHRQVAEMSGRDF